MIGPSITLAHTGSFAQATTSLSKSIAINEVKKEGKLPVLSKDFFIDPYQVYLAKSFGADAILIILAAIDEKTAKEIYNTA